MSTTPFDTHVVAAQHFKRYQTCSMIHEALFLHFSLHEDSIQAQRFKEDTQAKHPFVFAYNFQFGYGQMSTAHCTKRRISPQPRGKQQAALTRVCAHIDAPLFARWIRSALVLALRVTVSDPFLRVSSSTSHFIPLPAAFVIIQCCSGSQTLQLHCSLAGLGWARLGSAWLGLAGLGLAGLGWAWLGSVSLFLHCCCFCCVIKQQLPGGAHYSCTVHRAVQYQRDASGALWRHSEPSSGSSYPYRVR